MHMQHDRVLYAAQNKATMALIIEPTVFLSRNRPNNPCTVYTGVSHSTVCRVCTAWKRSSDHCIECWVLWKILKTLAVDFNPGFTVSVLATAFSSREVKGVTWYSSDEVVLVRHEHYSQLWAGYHVFEISKAVVIICFELLLVLSNISPQTSNTPTISRHVVLFRVNRQNSDASKSER